MRRGVRRAGAHLVEGVDAHLEEGEHVVPGEDAVHDVGGAAVAVPGQQLQGPSHVLGPAVRLLLRLPRRRSAIIGKQN